MELVEEKVVIPRTAQGRWETPEEQTPEAGLFTKIHKHRGVHPIVSNPAFSTDTRLMHFAYDRINNVGHIHLDAGELEAAFPDVSRASLFRTLKKLRDNGFLAPDSTKLFLVVPTEIASQGLKRGQKCPRDCDGKFWSTNLGGWVDPRDMNRTGIEEADWAAGVRDRMVRNRRSEEQSHI
ncbi:hypothetical protein ABZS79_30195 [Streptomyces griseoloalbus]|uniref:hypothetical protein n=1 Tax=Streptomyces griseoloalbus TaxID=67303 RepID=UPI00339FCF3C